MSRHAPHKGSYNVHSASTLKFHEAIELYAKVVKRAPSAITAFFFDVKTLEGKLPDGTFEKGLTPEQSALLDGFSAATMPTYVKNLSATIRSRLSEHQVKGKNDKGIRRFVTYAQPRAADSELKFCRDLAIGQTLEELIPGYTPKGASLEYTGRVISTPTGGQPGYRR